MSDYRRLILEEIVRESDSAKSFYFAAQDGQPLAPYRPGQHLQLRIQLPEHPRPVARFYTISDYGNSEYYRLTIKKESSPPHQPDAPAGAVSGFFHDSIRVGDVIQAKAPSGDFFLDLEKTHPVVFVAGGIGVTPLLSMTNAVVKYQPERDVYFLYAVRHGGEQAFKSHLQEIADAYRNFHLFVCFDEPRKEDRIGHDYDHHGRIDISILKQFLPTLQLEYYICGPGPMMECVINSLKEAEIAESVIHTESFGPSSTAYKSVSSSKRESIEDNVTVKFLRSGKSVLWDNSYDSLLQFAEDHDVAINSGCLFGDCATCMTGLLSGEVDYNHPTAVQPESSACLPCSCRPKGSITLDA